MATVRTYGARLVAAAYTPTVQTAGVRLVSGPVATTPTGPTIQTAGVRLRAGAAASGTSGPTVQTAGVRLRAGAAAVTSGATMRTYGARLRASTPASTATVQTAGVRLRTSKPVPSYYISKGGSWHKVDVHYPQGGQWLPAIVTPPGGGGGTTPAHLFAGPAGLVTVQSQNISSTNSWGVNHGVIKVLWSAIEPNSDGVYNWSAVDNYLTSWPNEQFTLRIQAGGGTPDAYKKAHGGASLHITNDQAGATADVGYFWLDDIHAAWIKMQTAAAARYNANPRICMVSADLCMTVYSEPFILGDATSRALLFNATNNGANVGYTPTVQAQVIARDVSELCALWPNTRVELAIHEVLQVGSSTGSYGVCTWASNSASIGGRALALQIIRANPAGQVVISDYSLNENDLASKNVPTGTLDTETNELAWMSLLPAAGTYIGWQLTLKDASQATSYQQAAQNAIDMNAGYCETSGWGSAGNPPGATLDAGLKAQAAPAT